MTADPYKYFRIEAREIADALGAGFLALDHGATPDDVQRLLRHAHTLKGAARVVRLPEIAERAHAIEDALAPWRDVAGTVPAGVVSALLAALDAIRAGVTALDGPASGSKKAPLDEPVRSVRADLGDMDALLDGIIETHGRVGALRGTAAELGRLCRIAELAVSRLARDRRVADETTRTIEQLRDLLRTCERGFDTGLDHVDRELRQVRDLAEHLRLVPAGSLFGSLERTVRDIGAELGRAVAFDATGGDLRLDAPVISVIGGALVQLVRNAVAHGIEPEATRRHAGKPARGRVEIAVARRGRKIVFSCRDDGRGLDLDAIRRVAIERGVSPENLDAGALVQQLLRGGISTSTAVTEVSGRGVGLDVVRDACSRLGGDITVATGPAGTRFEIVVPVSLAAIEALIVEGGGAVVAIPLDAVRHTRRIDATMVSRSANTESLVDGGAALPFIRLAATLGQATRPCSARNSFARDERPGIAALIAGSTGVGALGIDRLIGTTTIVVRAIPDRVDIDPIVAGAWLDADGVPKLVLDPDGVVEAARRDREVERPAGARRIAILVIDDSLTTRMLEQSILESAGYEVDTAISAEHGLVAAAAKPYALFLVDVEMPGMDGFAFIEHVRTDPTLRDTPALLVTSRASAEDRRRGDEVGANGYIIKSEFDQVDLLARIQRMVG
jgi:two-component system chemotaxis sensor kinase CheA